MEHQIGPNELLQIIGSKEVELKFLRERIAQLEQERQKQESKPLQTDPIE